MKSASSFFIGANDETIEESTKGKSEEAHADKQLDLDDSVYCLTFTCMIFDIRNKFAFETFL